MFTVTEALDEELIRIRTQWIKTSETFILFIPFAGGFHALWVFSFHPMWNVRCMIGFMNAPKSTRQKCELLSDGNAMFCNILHLAQWDSPGRYHLGGWYALWSWSISQAGWQSFSPESLKWNWSSHAQVKLQTHSSLRNSLSHPTARFQTSPARSPISFHSRLSPTHKTHTRTTLILFHHFCFPPLLPSLFSLSPSASAMWGMYNSKFIAGSTAPLCFVSYILIFIIQNWIPYSCSYPSSCESPLVDAGI